MITRVRNSYKSNTQSNLDNLKYFAVLNISYKFVKILRNFLLKKKMRGTILTSIALAATVTSTPLHLIQKDPIPAATQSKIITPEIIKHIHSSQSLWLPVTGNDPTHPFHDWTVAQVQRLLNSARSIPSSENSNDPDPWGNKRHALPFKSYEHVNATFLPAHFDSREKWYDCQTISLVRDQGDCGSCWAFGATTPMSDRLCIHSNGTIQDLLSARDLMTCCRDCLGDVTAGGCEGGYSHEAYHYWMTEGIVSGMKNSLTLNFLFFSWDLYRYLSGDNYGTELGCQPYPIPINLHHRAVHVVAPTCERACTNAHVRGYDADKYRAKEVYRLPPMNEDAMRWEIMTNGPVTAGYDVYEDFPLYMNGVYVKTSETQLGGHDVTILGWGEQNGVKYWMIKNSWNRLWGHHGFFKIRRGTNECGIESDVVAGIPDV